MLRRMTMPSLSLGISAAAPERELCDCGCDCGCDCNKRGKSEQREAAACGMGCGYGGGGGADCGGGSCGVRACEPAANFFPLAGALPAPSAAASSAFPFPFPFPFPAAALLPSPSSPSSGARRSFGILFTQRREMDFHSASVSCDRKGPERTGRDGEGPGRRSYGFPSCKPNQERMRNRGT